MGDIADNILDGDMCQFCGEIMEGDGYPQTCASCLEEGDDCHYGKPVPVTVKVACPECGKKVKEVGLKDHIRDVHNK